jgi:hypothetical protein
VSIDEAPAGVTVITDRDKRVAYVQRRQDLFTMAALYGLNYPRNPGTTADYIYFAGMPLMVAGGTHWAQLLVLEGGNGIHAVNM